MYFAAIDRPILLDGKTVADRILEDLKTKVAQGLKVKLAVILVGDNPASEIYVRKKKEACEIIGVGFELIRFNSEVSGESLKSKISSLNNDEDVSGILVQLPLPRHICVRDILDSILPSKDVDGLTSYNLGRLIGVNENIQPATPKGIIRLLREYNIDVKGSNVVIVNNGVLVGKPLALMMINELATVTVCHKFTKNLESITKKADIIVTAVGIRGLITSEMVKEGVIVVDVGISRKKNRIFGDVDFEGVKKKASHITPVPGGVGPMTVAVLLDNLLKLKTKLL